MEINVHPLDTIRQVKEKIAREYGAPPKEQILKKHFVTLGDSCTVASCNLKQNDTLIVAMEFRASGEDSKYIT